MCVSFHNTASTWTLATPRTTWGYTVSCSNLHNITHAQNQILYDAWKALLRKPEVMTLPATGLLQ